jgi:hypothetical protein
MATRRAPSYAQPPECARHDGFETRRSLPHDEPLTSPAAKIVRIRSPHSVSRFRSFRAFAVACSLFYVLPRKPTKRAVAVGLRRSACAGIVAGAFRAEPMRADPSGRETRHAELARADRARNHLAGRVANRKIVLLTAPRLVPARCRHVVSAEPQLRHEVFSILGGNLLP